MSGTGLNLLHTVIVACFGSKKIKPKNATCKKWRKSSKWWIYKENTTRAWKCNHPLFSVWHTTFFFFRFSAFRFALFSSSISSLAALFAFYQKKKLCGRKLSANYRKKLHPCKHFPNSRSWTHYMHAYEQREWFPVLEARSYRSTSKFLTAASLDLLSPFH